MSFGGCCCKFRWILLDQELWFTKSNPEIIWPWVLSERKWKKKIVCFANWGHKTCLCWSFYTKFNNYIKKLFIQRKNSQMAYFRTGFIFWSSFRCGPSMYTTVYKFFLFLDLKGFNKMFQPFLKDEVYYWMALKKFWPITDWGVFFLMIWSLKQIRTFMPSAEDSQKYRKKAII